MILLAVFSVVFFFVGGFVFAMTRTSTGGSPADTGTPVRGPH